MCACVYRGAFGGGGGGGGGGVGRGTLHPLGLLLQLIPLTCISEYTLRVPERQDLWGKG